METRDLAIKYKTLYKEIQIMLINIKELGFDISEYQNMLKEIDNSTNNNVKNVTGGSYLKRANYEQDYAKGLGELIKLKNHLDRYNCYFKTYNSCKWIEINIIKSNNISNEELNKYVSEMILNLKSINGSDTMDYDNEKHIVEDVYKVAYELIKLELIMTGKSELYLYIKNKDVNIVYFEEMMRKEISEIDLYDEKNIWLREKIHENYRSGINSSIFDIEVIKRILFNSDTESLKKTIIANLNNIFNDMENNLKEVNALLPELNKKIEKIDKETEYAKDSRNNAIRRMITMILSLSLMIGGGFGIERLGRKISKTNAYNKKTELYSSIDGKTTTKEEKIHPYGSPDNSVNIRVYGKYKNEYERDYKTYEVTFKDFDSLEEYYDYGVENYGVVPKDNSVNYRVENISNYQNSYTEVERITYEYLGKEKDSFAYSLSLVVGYVFYIIVLIGIEFSYAVDTDESLVISNLIEMIDEIKDYLEYKRQGKELDSKFKEEIEKLMTLINNNEVLRNRFNELYENNKYLLDNEEELIRKIDELKNNETIDNAKKLVKDNKRK